MSLLKFYLSEFIKVLLIIITKFIINMNNKDNISQTALAPPIISQSSCVILACLALLKSSVNFSRISPAFLLAFSIALILELVSLAVLFKRAL